MLFMAAVWSSVRYVTDPGLSTTGYGLCFCIQDMFCCVVPVLVGRVIDRTQVDSGGYRWVHGD